jgi:hypothetical protein
LKKAEEATSSQMIPKSSPKPNAHAKKEKKEHDVPPPQNHKNRTHTD